MFLARLSVLAGALAGACASVSPDADPLTAAALRKGFAFLETEIRAWRGANGCFSCHHNGDAARAVYLRERLFPGAGDPIPATSRWLRQPDQWHRNGTDGPFEDARLEWLQFAAALLALQQSPHGAPAAALRRAAGQLAAHQDPAGSWQAATGTRQLGSPITYGPTLATALARDVLVHADPRTHRQAVYRAERWLRRQPARNLVEAGGILLGLGHAADAAAVAQRQRCQALLARSQHQDGGFGPYPNATAEPFDTALAVVALAAGPRSAATDGMIRRAANWLRRQQEPDGGWLETTRPAGQESYAHRISTTGWVLQALLSATALGDRDQRRTKPSAPRFSSVRVSLPSASKKSRSS